MGLPCPKTFPPACVLTAFHFFCSVWDCKDFLTLVEFGSNGQGLLLDQTGVWKSRCQAPESGCYSCESTCVAVALLLPCSGWGTTSADIPAAADPTAAHLWTLDRAVRNMGVLTWPIDQSCGRHCALQLGGGGKGVGDAPHPQWWDTAVGQLALSARKRHRDGFKLQFQQLRKCFATKKKY